MINSPSSTQEKLNIASTEHKNLETEENNLPAFMEMLDEGWGVTFDKEKALEVQENCVKLFTRFLHEQEEDVALQNIMTMSVLIFNSFQAGPDIPVACAKGCGYCCHQPVGINLAEARTIALHLPTLSDTVRKVVLKRLKMFSHLSLKRYGETFINKKYPCPFLDREEGACLIYEVRPISCRRYISTSLSKCISLFEGNPHSETDSVMIPLNRVVAEILNHSVYLALRGFGDPEKELEPSYPMHMAVQYLVKSRKIK